MARKPFSVASFNVRNLVAADVTFHGTNRYSQAAYDRKLEWLAEQLYRIDADIVCLQVAFDPGPVEDLIARNRALAEDRLSARAAGRARYKWWHHAPNLDSTDDDPRPGLAIFGAPLGDPEEHLWVCPIADLWQAQL